MNKQAKLYSSMINNITEAVSQDGLTNIEVASAVASLAATVCATLHVPQETFITIFEHCIVDIKAEVARLQGAPEAKQ